MRTREKVRIAVMAAAVLAGNAGAVVYVWSWLAARMSQSGWRSLPLAFSVVQVFTLVLMVVVLFFLKVRRQRMERNRREGSANLRRVLAEYATGEITDAASRLRREHRGVGAELILEFVASLRGEQRQRLVELAGQLGLERMWQRQSRSRRADARRKGVAGLAVLGTPEALACLRERVGDRDPVVRLAAIRRLASAGRLDASAAFYFALGDSLYTRALVAEDLRSRAAELCGSIVPDALASGDREQTLAALDIVRSWRRSISLPQLAGLRWDGDAELAQAVVAIVPYLIDPVQQERIVSQALLHSDPSVRAAAAASAGQLGLRSFTERLAAMLHDSDPRAAREAAIALAQFGSGTWPVLEREVLRGGERAGIAVEALERAQTRRLTPVGA